MHYRVTQTRTSRDVQDNHETEDNNKRMRLSDKLVPSREGEGNGKVKEDEEEEKQERRELV